MKRRRIRAPYAAVAAGLAAAAFIYLGAVEPTANRWKLQERAIEKKTAVLNEHLQLLRKKNAFESEYSKIMKEVRTDLSPEDIRDNLLQAIGGIADRTSVRIQAMNPLPNRTFGSFRELPVRVEMETNLGNLSKFLYELRCSAILLDVRKITVSPRREGSYLLRSGMEISTIYYSEKERP